MKQDITVIVLFVTPAITLLVALVLLLVMNVFVSVKDPAFWEKSIATGEGVVAMTILILVTFSILCFFVAWPIAIFLKSAIEDKKSK